MTKQKIKIKIQYSVDREAVVVALANNGYPVTIEVDDNGLGGEIYYVAFEILGD